jgi:hypothetical protein
MIGEAELGILLYERDHEFEIIRIPQPNVAEYFMNRPFAGPNRTMPWIERHVSERTGK